MTKKEHIAHWLKSAELDISTMDYLFKGKRYVHALFFGHLYIEKITKALWIKKNKDNYPPKIHNILNILKQADATLDEDYLLFLLKLNQYQIDGRYPDDVDKLYQITNRQKAVEYIRTIKTIAKCLLDEMQ